MTQAPPILARVFRGGRVESGHRGAAALADDRGDLIAFCGSPSEPIFARSAAKPFQAMPLLLAGGEKRFRLSDSEIALLCASHGGEPRHTAVAAALLKRGGFRESDLECGAHMPMHEPSARKLIRERRAPGALHNNCSGKHAGMLLACRLLDWPHAGYTDPGHPLQRRIRALLAFYAGVTESEVTVAIDGCNAPVFRLPLAALAVAYARLLAVRVLGEEPAARAVRRRIVRAMVRRPEMVAGAGRFTTAFLRAGKGRWIGKEGAEGVYAVALAGRTRQLPCTAAVFKIEDGSARARDAITFALLDRMGGLPDSLRPALSRYAEPVIHNSRGRVVGRIQAEVSLTRVRRATRSRRGPPR